MLTTVGRRSTWTPAIGYSLTGTGFAATGTGLTCMLTSRGATCDWTGTYTWTSSFYIIGGLKDSLTPWTVNTLVTFLSYSTVFVALYISNLTRRFCPARLVFLSNWFLVANYCMRNLLVSISVVPQKPHFLSFISNSFPLSLGMIAPISSSGISCVKVLSASFNLIDYLNDFPTS